MSVTVSAGTSKERQPYLWGTSNVTPWPEGTSPRQSIVPLLEMARLWLETLIAPSKSFSGSSALTEEIIVMFEQLRELKIRVPAPDDVWRHLEERPHLIKATRDLAMLARERLPDAVLSLEISRDPEEGEEYVVLYARFRDYDGNVMKKIRAVREEFLSLLNGEPEWPLLTTDFRSPEEVD